MKQDKQNSISNKIDNGLSVNRNVSHRMYMVYLVLIKAEIIKSDQKLSVKQNAEAKVFSSQQDNTINKSVR